jgi:hypothetical protein
VIGSITIDALGPIDQVHHELGMGISHVVGPSEGGKTLGIIDATCFVLWGEDSRGRPFPVELIRDGHSEMSVQLKLVSGTSIYRKMDRKRKQVRQIVREGVMEEHPREDAFQLALGVLGADHELLRCIMVPFAWVPLAERNARPLRDLLFRVLPQMDLREVVAELMAAQGKALLASDPILEPEAVEARRVQNNVMERAGENLRVAEEIVVEENGALEPPVRSLESATAILANRRAWELFQKEQEAHHRWIDWNTRLRALGVKPERGAVTNTLASDLREAEEAIVATADQLHTCRKQEWPGRRELDAMAQTVHTARDAYNNAPENTICPTCKRRGWDEAKTFRTNAKQALDDAEHALEVAEANASDAVAAWTSDHQADLAGLEAQLTERRLRLASLREDFEASRTEDPTAAWEKAFRALGPEPTGRTGPSAPAIQNPPNEQVDEAHKTKVAWNEYNGAVRGRADAEQRNKNRLTGARAAHATAALEAERLDVLVSAVRAAPSIIAKQQAEALGDLGPVSIRFGTDPAVEVLFDKRPWYAASTGKRILCDLWLRAAIRRASGNEWLPLFVDERQSWSGPLPGFEPRIELWTAAGNPDEWPDALRVRQFPTETQP